MKPVGSSKPVYGNWNPNVVSLSLFRGNDGALTLRIPDFCCLDIVWYLLWYGRADPPCYVRHLTQENKNGLT